MNRLFYYILILSFFICIHYEASSNTYTKIGDVGQFVIPLTAFGITVFHYDKEGVYQFGKTFLTSITAAYVIKPVINETRPKGGRWSFPSGHTTAVFSSATFLQRRYGWRYGIPAYLASTFVGYSRVRAHMHWTRDVIAGAAIGVVSGFVFTTKYVDVTPIADKHRMMIELSKQF